MAKVLGVLLISLFVLMTSISFASAWVYEEVEVNQPSTRQQETWTYREDNYGHNQGFIITHTWKEPQYNYYVRTDSSNDGVRGYVNWIGNNDYNNNNYNNDRGASYYDYRILQEAMETYNQRHYSGSYYGSNYRYSRPSYYGYNGYVNRQGICWGC